MPHDSYGPGSRSPRDHHDTYPPAQDPWGTGAPVTPSAAQGATVAEAPIRPPAGGWPDRRAAAAQAGQPPGVGPTPLRADRRAGTRPPDRGGIQRAPARRRRMALSAVAAALLALGVTITLAERGLPAGTPATSAHSGGRAATPQPDDPASAAPVGTGVPVRDGDFDLTVRSVTCGVGRLGAGAMGKAPQGRYCLVRVSVHNSGESARLFDVGIQKGYAPDGTVLRPDSEAGLYANGDDAAFTDPVVPGGRTDGIIVFDVPAGTRLSVVELRETAFSPGVRVWTA